MRLFINFVRYIIMFETEVYLNNSTTNRAVGLLADLRRFSVNIVLSERSSRSVAILGSSELELTGLH